MSQGRSIRNPDLIDVDDLPASLARVEVQSYRWMDEGFELRIILELPEAVAKNKVGPLAGSANISSV